MPTSIPARRRFLLTGGLWAVPSLAKEDMTSTDPEGRLAALQQFIATKKFRAEGLYTGVLNEAARLRYETWVNELAQGLMALPPSEQNKAAVLGLFRPTMERFQVADSEDRDRFLAYLKELMDIFRIESSDGLLDKWRYGFDPREPLDGTNAKAISAMSPAERELLDQLSGLNSSNAEGQLRRLLGTPAADAPAMKIWLLAPDASSSITLSSTEGSLRLTWRAQNRFLYSRKL